MIELTIRIEGDEVTAVTGTGEADETERLIGDTICATIEGMRDAWKERTLRIKYNQRKKTRVEEEIEEARKQGRYNGPTFYDGPNDN